MLVLVPLFVVMAFGLPLVIPVPYFIHILTLCAMYTSFALSYDLSAGRLGIVSLAHPTFFGVGAYTAAILSTKYGFAMWADVILGMLVALTLAILVKGPAFRLRDFSFAIATLGLALSAQLVATNWVNLTEGPMCIIGIPQPFGGVGQAELSYSISRIGFYYVFVLLSLIVIGFYVLATTGRIGRTLTAVNNDEVLASTVGIDTLRYMKFSFLAGATIAAAVGGLWAHYISVVCPDSLSIVYTSTLLMMVFVGGAGNLWGVIAGAITITVIPELLRLAPSVRMILFGMVLIVMIVIAPRGLAGVFSRTSKRESLRGARYSGGDDTRDGMDEDSTDASA